MRRFPFAYFMLVVLSCSVFVHRYRDVDAMIRGDCVRELGYWIKTYHETFLEPHYLRYCGWMLSDKAPKTRLPAIVFLKDVLQDPQASTVFVPGLRQFLERFRPRIMDIARRDIDRRNREEATQVLVEGAVQALFGEEEETEGAILPMIVNESEVIRDSVAKYFVHVWQSAAEELTSEEADATAKSQAQLKSLAQLLCKALDGADARSNETSFTEDHMRLMGQLGPWYKREIANSAIAEIDGVHRVALAIEALTGVDDWSNDILSVRDMHSRLPRRRLTGAD